MAHVGPVAFAGAHPTPQPPQLMSVVTPVSQPVEGFESQLPQPVSHAPRVQVPVVHDSAAWSSAQGTPQAPQFVSVRMETSQPLDGFESQLPKPVLHDAKLQAPDAHVAPVALSGLQGVPQVAQSVNVTSDRSQPFAPLPSQSPQFVLQEPSVQMPVEHDSVALARSHGTP